MATNIPYNLQFGSYANFRDPNYQQIQQMLGSSRADQWAEWDIEAASEAAEQERWDEEYSLLQDQFTTTQENWEATFAASEEAAVSAEETAVLAREESQLNIDNLTAMYAALEGQYAEMFDYTT